MTTQSLTPPATDFVRIAPRTFIYTPEKHVAGQLIIVCSWLGAARKHIAKYTAVYQRITPQARILLIESDISILTSSYPKQREAIKPAVSVVLGAFSEIRESQGNTISAQILLHTFSNGGMNTAAQLLWALDMQHKSPLPLQGLLLDSCPGKGSYWNNHTAMLLSFPRDFASQMFGTLLCHTVLVLLYISIICGTEDPAKLGRRTVLDENFVSGGIGKGATTERRVCYLYSKTDEMILWTDVMDHAEDARAKGWIVEEVLFEGSGHCAHLAKDPTRYIEAIKKMWGDL